MPQRQTIPTFRGQVRKQRETSVDVVLLMEHRFPRFFFCETKIRDVSFDDGQLPSHREVLFSASWFSLLDPRWNIHQPSRSIPFSACPFQLSPRTSWIHSFLHLHSMVMLLRPGRFNRPVKSLKLAKNNGKLTE